MVPRYLGASSQGRGLAKIRFGVMDTIHRLWRVVGIMHKRCVVELLYTHHGEEEVLWKRWVKK